MARTLFFCMALRKSSEISNNKPIFSQYNIFYNYISFSSVRFDIFSIIAKEVNQIRNNVVSPCFLVLLQTHYWPLQCFSAYFRELREIGATHISRLLFLVTMVTARHISWANTSKGYTKISYTYHP